MIPSVVAAAVAGALGDFHATGFGPSNPALAHVIAGRSTVVATATGTGSGKTECRTPALRGKVAAGIFVGRDNQPQRSAHKAMGGDHVVPDRDTLRERPPDILLTNYKMLDYLLVRPFAKRC